MNNETINILLFNALNPRFKTKQKIGKVLTQDFSKVCRTCATVSDLVIPIFEGAGLRINLARKIRKQLPIQVSVDDGLPQVVCYLCASTLLASHDLVQCCVKADAAQRMRSGLAAARGHSAEDLKPSIKQPKFGEIEKSEVQPTHAPRFKKETPQTKTCVYCRTEQPEHLYNDHLLNLHSDYIFHCDECDTYVDCKEFLCHMTIHAREYATKSRIRPVRVKKVISFGRQTIYHKSSSSEKKPIKRPDRTDESPVKLENAKNY